MRVRGTKVEHNVDKEAHIHEALDEEQHALGRERKCDRVGHLHHRDDDEHHDDRVPRRAQPRLVVENEPLQQLVFTLNNLAQRPDVGKDVTNLINPAYPSERAQEVAGRRPARGRQQPGRQHLGLHGLVVEKHRCAVHRGSANLVRAGGCAPLTAKRRAGIARRHAGAIGLLERLRPLDARDAEDLHLRLQQRSAIAPRLVHKRLLQALEVGEAEEQVAARD
mmetsp:Transcript_16929/g.59202  ORF Transcript_16929/g.59202 Transcript_16929/m.59202 type:complete len:222 (+) Transcript_16929:527-1192(+)